MTFHTEPNRDAYTISETAGATGPLVGFFESWKSAVDVQMRTSAQYGIEYYMQGLDWEQTKALLDAGVENPPQLILELEGAERGDGAQSVSQLIRKDSGYYEDFIPSRSRPYLDVARMYGAGEAGDEGFRARLDEYDRQIEELRKAHPNLSLLTSREMFDRVREEAQTSERDYETDRRTFGGKLGGFLGGAVASLHPGTDPLNFYTAGIGGLGKTALQRILFQTGAQGGIETVNQVTGVQEERELLGLSHGLWDATSRVVGTAVGAGVLQGAGELVGAGVKRWFRSTPNDPAPAIETVEPPRAVPTAPPRDVPLREEAQAARIEADSRAVLDLLADEAPLSGIRTSAPRTLADAADVAGQLSDWTGPLPAATVPRTANVTFPDTAIRPNRVDVQDAMDSNRLYQLAKQADPRAFEQFERLTSRRDTYRRWLDELATQRDADVSATMERIEARLRSLEAQRATTQGKNAKAKLRQQIREVEADRDALIKASRSKETPDIAEVRRQIARTDERMRDFAPLIGRAYARARGRWGETDAELDAVWSAYQRGRTQPDMPSSGLPDYDTAMMTLADRAPVLRGSHRVEPGATSADTASAVIADNAKALDAALDAYRQEASRLVQSSDDGVLTIQGREYEFDIDKDKMFIPHEDGTGGREVSIREFLEDGRKAEDELEAVTTCSIG